MLKAAIFDLGGTLIEYQQLEMIRMVCETHWREISGDSELLRKMCEIYYEGRRKNKAALKETTILDSLAAAAKELKSNLSQVEIHNIVRNLYEFQCVKTGRVYDGAEETLKLAKELGLKVGLISNTPFSGDLHEIDLRRFHLADYFDIKVWSSDFGFKKPHPKIFLHALAEFPEVTSPREAVYVGDMFDRDVEGANNVGMPAIWIGRDKQQPFFGWQVNNIREVANAIRKLKEG